MKKAFKIGACPLRVENAIAQSRKLAPTLGPLELARTDIGVPAIVEIFMKTRCQLEAAAGPLIYGYIETPFRVELTHARFSRQEEYCAANQAATARASRRHLSAASRTSARGRLCRRSAV